MSDTQALSVNVAGHCRAINALADKLASAERKVDEYQRAIGQYSAAIKKECPDDWQSMAGMSGARHRNTSPLKANLTISVVHASRSKQARAEPVAALCEQRRVTRRREATQEM